MSWRTRVYAALLYLYPPSFRHAHGREMLQMARTAERHGSLSTAGILVDLLASLPREWMYTIMLRDLRSAVRTLSRHRGFTVAAVVTLALGIGANTAIFTLADATLLRPVHVSNPHELVVWSWTSSYPDYLDYTKQTDVFRGVVAVSGASRMNLTIDGIADLVLGTYVSGNAFDVLGVGAAHGRPLLPSDDVQNGPAVGVLSHDYWRSRFNEDPAVVGRLVRVNGKPLTIVGVAEEGFRGTTILSNPALYIPVTTSVQSRTGFLGRFNPLTERGMVWLNVIARLQPGVTAEQASAVVDTVYARPRPPLPPGRTREHARLEPLPVRALGRGAADVRTFILLLAGVVGLTLLIGCANLANLLLAKAASRRREMGVRLALGATRTRVIQQMLAESVLLAIAGGAVGIVIARFALQLLGTYELPGGINIAGLHLSISGAALTVAFALSLLTALLFGALPAWRASRTDVLVSLRDESRSATARSRTRTILLGAQVAISVVLLAGAVLFARSLAGGLRIAPGFNADDVLTASVNLGLASYEPAAAKNFYEAALERVTALPQVQMAAWTNLIPTRGLMMGSADVEGYAKAAEEEIMLYGSHVGPGYFRVAGTRVLAGREFTAQDVQGAAPVAVINDVVAKKYFGGREPVGGRIRMFDTWITVVGVVERTVVRDLKEVPLPQVYFAFNQWLMGREGIATDAAHLFIRTNGDAEGAAPLVRDQLRSLDRELPLYDIAPLENKVASLLMPQRLGVTLLALFSVVAVALAVVGIYGVATYVTALRTREIGVRMALGATDRAVRGLIVRDGAAPVIGGMIVGLALALYTSRLAEAFLYGVSRFDPVTFISVPIALAVVALAATYVPARRASRIQPIEALRHE